jgi:hypothetical protein
MVTTDAMPVEYGKAMERQWAAHRAEVSRLEAEIERLRVTLTEIWECSRSLTGYCQWCDARPEINHQLDCPAELALDAIFVTTQEDVERLGLSSEQTVILREHLASRQQTVSEFLGDVLMEYGLGRTAGKEYPSSTQFVEHGYTCGICNWGRADQPRTYEDYMEHMKIEHPKPTWDDLHAVNDQHPCFICGRINSHDHSIDEWNAAYGRCNKETRYHSNPHRGCILW